MPWAKVLDAYGATTIIYDLCIFNGKIYAVATSPGSLLEWDGLASAWNEVVNIPAITGFRSEIVFQSQLYMTGFNNAVLYRFDDPGYTAIASNPSTATVVYNMAEFLGCIYGTVDRNGYIYKWDPLSPSSWSTVYMGGAFYPYYYSIVVFNNKLYLGSNSGTLVEYDGASYNVVATQYASETFIRLLVVYNGSLYGFSYPSGYILRWDGVSAWVYVATIPNFEGAWRAIEMYGMLYIVGDPTPGNNVVVYSFNGAIVAAETPENTAMQQAYGILHFNDLYYVAGDCAVENTALYGIGISGPPEPYVKAYTQGDIWLHLEDNQGNIEILNNDLRRDPTLENAIEISLFTDRRADDIDALPDTSGDKRGWWGDDVSEKLLGSKLWLLRRSKNTSDIPARTEQYVKEALQWMIDDGVIDSFEVSVQQIGSDRLDIEIIVLEPKDQTENIFKYYFNWREQRVSTGRTA